MVAVAFVEVWNGQNGNLCRTLSWQTCFEVFMWTCKTQNRKFQQTSMWCNSAKSRLRRILVHTVHQVIGALQRINYSERHTQALILAPTRELANQRLGWNMKSWLREQLLWMWRCKSNWCVRQVLKSSRICEWIVHMLQGSTKSLLPWETISR